VLLKHALSLAPEAKGTFQHTLNSGIFRIHSIKDLGVFHGSEFYSHQHAECLFSHAIKLLGLILTTTLSVSLLDSSFMLYISLDKTKMNMFLLPGIVLPTVTPTN
jgi:hypothetical protein